MKTGDIVFFKGQGLMFRVLSTLLCLFDSYWRKLKWKPWHTAIAFQFAPEGWYILEARAEGVILKYYEDDWLKEHTRAYTWLDTHPTKEQMQKLLDEYIGKPYDIAIYFWTSLAIILRHFWNHPIPKLFDDRWDCWELDAQGMSDLGKPVISKFDTVLITDLAKAVGIK